MKKAFLFYAFLLLAMSLQAKNYFSQYGFIENKGQIIDQNNNLNPAVKYLWTGNGMKVQLKGNSFSYEVLKSEHFEYRNPTSLRAKRTTPTSLRAERSEAKQSTRDCFVPRSDGAFDDSTVIYSHRVDIELLNANPHPQIIAEEKSADYDNYYTTGTPEEGVTFVYHYSKVTYKDIYPNIDLEFISDAKNEKGFKYNFIVRPGGNVADIQLQYNGATKTSLNKQGNLAVATTSGDFEESIPKSYIAETGANVTVQYTAKGGHTFGFQASACASNQTLIIDPWCTYYGAISGGEGYDIATDKSNNIVVTGWTASTTNIASTGAFQTAYGGGNEDAFVVKFNSSGSRIWGTYYGGVQSEDGYAVCIDKFGNIYMHGGTVSPNGIATPGAFQTSYFGGSNGMLVKFNSNGIRIWGTYYGGDNITNIAATDGFGMTIDTNSNVYVTGESYSPTNIATTGTYQSTLPSADSAGGYIIKFDSSGNRIWGTYVYYCNGSDLVIDNSGNIIFAGITSSSTSVATSGCFQPIFGGFEDAVLAKYNSSGTQLLWRTYYGGNDDETDINGGCLSLDNIGNIILTGSTESGNNIASSGAYQANLLGAADGYIAKFNTNGVRLWGTYFGGNGGDGIYSSIPDNTGNIYVTGATFSSNNIATPGVFQQNLIGYSDAFLAKFSSSGSRIWGTYLGGINNNLQNEYANAVATDGIGNIIIAGLTYATSNISTSGAFQTTPAKIFIASFDNNGTLTPTPAITSNSANAAQAVCSGVQPALLMGSSPSGGSGVYGYLWLQSTTSATSGFYAATGTNNTQNYQPPLLSTTTWYKRIVMSGSNADTTSSIQITVNAAPNASVTAGGATTFCQGGSVNLGANTGSGLSYQWQNNNANINGETNANYTATTTGVYQVIIAANGCLTTSNTITVTVNPVSTANVTTSGNTTFCHGGNVTLDATTGTGLNYQWYNGGTAITGATNSGYVDTTSGSFTVIITNGSNCSDTSSVITVTVNPLPTVTITQNGNILNSSGSFNTYQWYYNSTAISGATNANYNPTQTGNYYLIVTNGNNCSGQSNTVSFTVGIDDVTGGHLFSVSPNPFKESFVVNCSSGKGSLVVVDAIGKVVKSVVVKSASMTIDMKGFAAGVYLIRFEDGENKEIVKVVKE